MKELSFEEVLRIAGGLPVTAALDEVTYQDPDPERLLPGPDFTSNRQLQEQT